MCWFAVPACYKIINLGCNSVIHILQGIQPPSCKIWDHHECINWEIVQLVLLSIGNNWWLSWNIAITFQSTLWHGAMPVPTSKTPIGRGVIILKLIVYNKIQVEVSLRISACALFSLQPYAYGRSALKHASSRVLAWDDLLRSLPTWMHSVILWGVDCCHGLSWVRAEQYCTALASVIRDRIPATHQLTLQSPPCSSPLSFLFQKYFWEPADLLRDFTDGLTYFCFDTGTKKRSLTRSVKLCGSGCWYQSLFILFHE